MLMELIINYLQFLISLQMSIKNKTANPLYHLLIKMQHIEFRSSQIIKDEQFVYFSCQIGERMYFFSCINSHSSTLSDDILIPITEQQLPQFLMLHRWQNHMILLSHQIDISQLKTRTTTKKKHETKAGQILSLMILVLNNDQIKFGEKYIQSISQHYLIVQQMFVKQNKTQKRADIGPSYYQIRTSGSNFVMPVLDGQICIKLPETLEFEHIRNGETISKSRQYSSDELKQSEIEVQMSYKDGSTSSLCLKLKWGVNLFETKTQNSLLLQAHEVIIYDIQVKFDNYSEFANAKVKFVYGNKGFEVGNQFNNAKPAKIKKIVYFIIKSQDEQISIIVERNLKVVAQSKFYTDQINSYTVHCPKRKLIDDNGKQVGIIKFKCEKAKNLSTPNNNKFWKESNKKKLINTVLLSIQQISVFYQKNQPVCVVVKSESEERVVNNVPNFLYFDKELQISYAPIVVSAKPEENIYMMIKNKTSQQSQQGNQGQNDFIGIAILNFSQLRLGENSTEIPFFKNQGKTATLNCLINKVTPYPFVKSIFQPENLASGAHKTMSLSIFMKKVNFTPYFYTYRYDNKNQVYCIVQANRLKKVLIMESIIHDDLAFLPSSSSDSLNFYIQQAEYIKAKITFLVSDVGHEQQIYGSAIVKMKNSEISAAPQGIKFNKTEIKNDFGTNVGYISFQVHHGVLNNSRVKQQKMQSVSGPFKSDIKRVQNDINKINENMQIMQRSVKKSNKIQNKSPLIQKLRKSQDYQGNSNIKKPLARYDNSINYVQKRRQRNHSVAGTNNESIILPSIKDARSNNYGNKNKNSVNLKDLVNMMRIRKRDTRGYYEQNQNVRQYQPKHPASERQYDHNLSHQYDPPFHTEKGSRENPDVEKSMQIIFPTKKNKNQIQNQISEYEQKLRQLKSALNNGDEQKNIEQEAQQEPPNTLRNRKNRAQQQNALINNNFEFEDNQFVRPPS